MTCLNNKPGVYCFGRNERRVICMDFESHYFFFYVLLYVFGLMVLVDIFSIDKCRGLGRPGTRTTARSKV